MAWKFFTSSGAEKVSASPSVAYGTSLPASPSDGMEAILVDSVTAPTYQWRFRYNSSNAGSYKWEFIGGAPALVRVATSESTSSTTGADLATVMSFTAPRAGTYRIEQGFNSTTLSGGGFSYSGYKVGAGAYVDLVLSTNDYDSVSAVAAQVTAAASDAIKMQFRGNSTPANPVFQDRWMVITPIQVS